MADPTVLDVVAASLREIGVIAARETPSAADAEDGRLALNNLLDQWAAERLQIFTIKRNTAVIGALQASFTIGLGASVNRQPPAYIDHINRLDITTTPNTEYPLTPLTDDAWAGLVLKDQTAPFPTAWHSRRQDQAVAGFLQIVVNVWPVPTASWTVVVYAPLAVQEFASLFDAVILPPGYRRLLVKSLACELAPSYGRQPDPMLVQQAREAKAVVKAANSVLSDLSFERGALIGNGGGTYSIYTG